MNRIPLLVKRGWSFEHMWLESTAKFSVCAVKWQWGIREHFYDADWDKAHELAAEWAAAEERVINGPDTERAPAMLEGAAV